MPQPLVSVVTPVFNGAKYLAQCIESVLAQTYQNWEYLIVNNCSSDATLEIATRYARQESRVHLITNRKFVDVIENHNIAFRQISAGSEYCKVVSADDYLYPECIERLVQLAEEHARVGIVGSYALTDRGIHWVRLPIGKQVFSGSEICRLYLRGHIDPVGAPSSLLYRSNLLRSHEVFFPGKFPNADWAACLRSFRVSDFGFVPQVLSYERIHDEALSANIQELNGFLIDRIQFLHEYGPLYLSTDESQAQRRVLLKQLYREFALGAIHLRGRKYWSFQKHRLEAAECPIEPARVAGAVLAKIADLLLNPKKSIEKIMVRGRTTQTTRQGRADPESRPQSGEALSKRC